MSDMGLDKDSEIFLSATTIHGGRGDMAKSPGGPPQIIQKFCNGVHVPVFRGDGDESSSNKRPQQVQRSKVNVLPFGKSNSDMSIMDLYTCPICLDPMIEATVTSCGHTFCAACLEEWHKIKPICPICSKEVLHRIRLYNEDQFIEWLLRTNDDFPAELGRRLYEATKNRMEKREIDMKYKSMLKKIRGKLDDFRLSCKSKGTFGAIRNQLYEPVAIVTSKIGVNVRASASKLVPTRGLISDHGYLILALGVTIGLFGAIAIPRVWSGTYTNFFYYLYLSIKNYDGTIPTYLLNGPEQLMIEGKENINFIGGASRIGTTAMTQEEYTSKSIFQMVLDLISSIFGYFW